ncbi:CxxxxCH/CxxCH domain c-type cytochrome [Desulfuromonas carbonis]
MTNAQAAVVVDTPLANVINVAATTGNGTVSAGNGTNRLMVLGCTTEYGTAGPGTYTINANYGGQTFTTIASNGSQRQTAWIGYINETKIAAASNTTLTATISQTTNARDLMCGVVVYENVDQGTPIAGSNAQASAGATSFTFTNIPSAVDGYAVYIAGNNGQTATVSAGFTEAFDVATTQSNGAGGDGATTATTVTGTVTFAASSRSALAMATVNPLLCSDTNGSAVTLTNPTNGATVSGSIAITTNLTNASNVEYSIDGGAWTSDLTLWNSANTHPASNTAPVTGVTVDVRAIEDECGGYVTDSITVTVDNTCSESIQSSIIWNGTNTAAGDFSGASFVTLTDVNTMEYQVTEGAMNPPFTAVTDDFSAVNANDIRATAQPTWSTWTPLASSAATNNWCYGNSATGTPSGGTGTTPGNPIPYMYLEASAAGTSNCGDGETGGTSHYLESPVYDASAYALNFTFDYYMEVATNTDASLHLDAWNGTAWDTDVTGAAIRTGDGGTTWYSVGPVDLSAYTNADFKLRIRYIAGTISTYQNDLMIDNLAFIGTPRSSETTVIPWTTDPIAASGVLTNGNSYNLYARGLDTECGVAYYGDSVAQSVSPGTSQTFTWSACTETATLTLNPIADPITGNVTVTASGTATGITVGTTPAAGNANGWVYTPAQDDNTTTVSFYATGTGICGTLTDSQLNVSTNTMAAPTIDSFSVNAVVTDTAAPLEIPINSFTASDNVAVTGYMITVDNATAPLATDAGWSPTAPTSVTVGAYATYTLRAYAKDAAGNVSAASTASVTVQNCVESGTVSVSISPDPGAGNIGISGVTVTANLGGGATNGLVRWRENGTAWSSWVASGATYTPTNKYFGTVDFEAMADGNCGATSPVYSTTLNRTFETRVDALEPTVQSIIQSGLTSFRVTMVYCNDKNGTGTYQVEYKLSTDPDIPASWTTVTNTPTADGGAGDADGTLNEDVIVLQGGLTSGAIYDVRLTYIDATDGIVGAPAVYNLQVELVAWVDDPMLHNALRFACDKPGFSDQTSCEANGGTWTLDRKWATGWGTPTGEYGAIVCATCHTKNATNVKKVTSTVLASSGSFPGSAVTLTTVEDTTSDFGNDAGGHATSSNICEVCHSVTAYHRYDTTSDPDGAGPLTAQVELNHYNQADCIKCHEHKLGFRAGCNACHGNPPLAVGELTGTLDPANDTLSTTPGEHDVHVNTLGYTDCNTCHNGWQTNGEMPKGGDVNLGFVTPGTNGGTYDGRTTNSGYTSDVNTTVTTGNGMTCAVYCHGYQTPQWNPTATAACGACHGEAGSFADDRAGAPTGGTSLDLSGAGSGFKVGKHANHLDNSIAETGDPCALCHFGTLYADATHVDGTVNVTLRQAAQSGDGSTGGAGTSALFTSGGAGAGTCSSMDCHGDAQWDSNAAGGCTLCHGYPPVAASSHASGVNPVNHDMFSATGVKDNHDDCRYCHGYKDNGSGVLLPLTGAEITALKGDATQAASLAGYHMDGKVTINGDFNTTAGDDAGYNSGNGGCDSAACHANDTSHRFTSANGANLQLADIGPGACTTCHSGGDPNAPVVTVGTSSHTNITIGGAASDCTECHSGHYTSGSGVQIPNNANVGIEYLRSGHGGIMLGGDNTSTVHTSIRGLTTEAEICWGCHTAAGVDGEFGTNNNADGITYNYGSLNQANWVGATWTSAVFSYKTGAIQSTHTANSAGTSAVSGANYAKTETLDVVGNIRCSYCHDVHDLNQLASDGSSGKPWLRGTWKGNPYNEDGAPRNGAAGTWLSVSYGGATNTVPRANAGANNSTTKGGYWIDQNSNDPNNGETLATTAGLCTLCHGTNVDTMDETTGENLWVSGGNGHQNAVIGGSGTTATANNIFSIRKRGSNQVWDDNGSSNYYMSMGGWTPQMARRAYGYRGDAGNIAITPNLSGEHRYFSGFQWDNPPAGMALQVDDYTMAGNSTTTVGAITQSQYHTFNCGKCHNPHASRLPKLMITNCLDTKQNTWDNTFNTGAPGAPSPWTGTYVSQWPTAQNCHRLADDHSTTSRGAGWNTVTPW